MPLLYLYEYTLVNAFVSCVFLKFPSYTAEEWNVDLGKMEDLKARVEENEQNGVVNSLAEAWRAGHAETQEGNEVL